LIVATVRTDEDQLVVDALPSERVLSVLCESIDGRHHIGERVDLVHPEWRRSAPRATCDARVETGPRRVGAEVGADAHDACHALLQTVAPIARDVAGEGAVVAVIQGEGSSAAEQVFIDGVAQPLQTHQTRLFERYRYLPRTDLPKAYRY